MPHAPVSPRSLWWQGAADGAVEPLRGDTSADVVVIGGGIVGVTLAVDLAQDGMDVLLLEAGRVGSGATGHTSAKATALQSPRYARIEREHGAGAAAAYAALSVEAVERIRTDAASFGEVDAEDVPALTWTHDDDAVDELREEGRAARRASLAVQDVAAHDRFELAHGLRLDDQLQFSPLAHLRGLRDRGLAAGLRIREHTPVTGVSMLGSTRTVATERGTVRADTVVVATGLPILDRGGWFARMEPQRSYVVALESDDLPTEMGLRVGGATRSSRAARTADARSVLLVAGAGHRVGRGGDTRRHPVDLRAWARLTFGATDEVASWSAQDWAPADGLPLVGPIVPGDHRVLAAAGFDKWGLTSGTAAAASLRRRINGSDVTDVDRLLDPARLPGARGARRLASSNGTVGWEMASGWLRALRGPVDTDLPAEGEGRVERHGTTPTAVATVDGVTHRCRAVCPHLGGVVRWDDAGRDWSCPLHGSRFDVDGRVLSGPTTSGLPPA